MGLGGRIRMYVGPWKVSFFCTISRLVPPEVNILVNLWLQGLVIQGLTKLTYDNARIVLVKHFKVSLPLKVLGIGSVIPVQIDQILG
jgi:hypothetical protein